MSVSIGRGGKQRGFTMIELMIVVVVVAILAAIAFPQYRDYIVRSNRAIAKSLLTQVADRQEQFYTANKRYSDDLTDLGYPADPFFVDRNGKTGAADGGTAIYSIGLDAANDTSYLLAADVLNTQAAEDARCTKFTLNQVGQRQAEGSTAAACW